MRYLHLHSSFAAGGKELRAARLMNAFGPEITHVVVSAQPEAYGAKVALSRRLCVQFPSDFPSLQGAPTPARLLRIARAMQGFDLILTYNWGAMDAVMAHCLYRDFLKLPPLVHHEDGFNEDEAQRLKTTRNWFRRIALGKASALVVPSRQLEYIGLEVWKQPRRIVNMITNGVDIGAFVNAAKPNAVKGLRKSQGQKWVGTLAGMRAVKNLPRLVRAFAGLPEDWNLVILGEGPERQVIEAQVRASGVADRVHMPGFIANPATVVGLFDIFALSSESEQFPISVVEAMAAGIPVASPNVGDLANMLSNENRAYLTAAGDEAALSQALATLAADSELRDRLGKANQAYAQAYFDEKAMIASYRRVYAKALGTAAF